MEFIEHNLRIGDWQAETPVFRYLLSSARYVKVCSKRFNPYLIIRTKSFLLRKENYGQPPLHV